MRRLLTALAFASVWPGAALAQPSLDGPLTDHGVLQRDTPIALSGTAAPGGEVEIALAGQGVSVMAGEDGAWMAELPGLPAGGPYELSLTDSDGTTQIEDLLIGDVWLCSGQSNMEYPVYRALNPDREIAGPHSEEIRLLKVPLVSDPLPQDSFPEGTAWTHATPETVRGFSAVCYFTGRALHEAQGVPIGLINASWGGSQIEAWLPAASLREVGGFEDKLAQLDLYAEDPSAAIAAFGKSWEAWWRENFDTTPWTGDGAEEDWSEAPAEMADWKTYGDPMAENHLGRAWYALQFSLTPDQAAQAGTLHLGGFDDVDATWLNGEFLGSTFGWGDPRVYDVELRDLKPGANTLYINILNTWGSGGMLGPAEDVKLVLDDGSEVALGLGWRYVMVANGSQGEGPRVPWESVGGFTSIYNGMIHPLGAYPMRGGIWYQGETNAGRGEAYAGLLSALTAHWRAAFNPDMPVVVVQLPGYGGLSGDASWAGWGTLREAQRQVALSEDMTGLAVAIDAGERTDIHPANKQLVAERVTRVALGLMGEAETFVDGVAPLGVERSGDWVRIAMPDAGLKAVSGGRPTSIAVCEGEGACDWADALISGDAILVYLGEASLAREIRYCWGDAPICNLYTGDDLPVAPLWVELD